MERRASVYVEIDERQGACWVYVNELSTTKYNQLFVGLALACWGATVEWKRYPVIGVYDCASSNLGGAALRDELRRIARDLRDRSKATIRAAGHMPVRK